MGQPREEAEEIAEVSPGLDVVELAAHEQGDEGGVDFSDDGGEVNAVFVSLLASCSLHKIEPFAYMRDLLCLVPRWPSHRVLELAPAYWRETLEKREAQEDPERQRPPSRRPAEGNTLVELTDLGLLAFVAALEELRLACSEVG